MLLFHTASRAGRGLGTRLLANIVCPCCALASAVFWLRPWLDCVSAWTCIQKMLFPRMAIQVQRKEMCSKQSGDAEFIWTICSFWFPIVIALKQLFKAKTSVLCPFPVMKSRRNTHQSILHPWIGLEMSFCKFIFNSFLPELPNSWSVSCFNLHWKSRFAIVS